MDVMMVAVVRLNMQYTCAALSRQTSRLRGISRLQMLCIKAAHAFNTHIVPQCYTRIHSMCKLTSCVNALPPQSSLDFTLTLSRKKKVVLISQSKDMIDNLTGANSTATLTKGWSLNLRYQRSPRSTDGRERGGGGLMTRRVDVVTFGIHIRVAHAPRRSEKH